MERYQFVQHFSKRLAQLICEKGYSSERSKTGIDIQKLSKISGSSYQMARKYALGQALPEIPIIIKIANWLETSPGHLLFGEEKNIAIKQKSNTIIEIEPDLLKYILSKSVELLSLTNDTDNIINFIVETVYDATHLNVDTKTVHKIIDMMISSATLLNKPSQDNKKICGY